MTRSNGVAKHTGIDRRSKIVGDDSLYFHPHKYREIPPYDWGPIAGPVREEARLRISARESAALAAFCVR